MKNRILVPETSSSQALSCCDGAMLSLIGRARWATASELPEEAAADLKRLEELGETCRAAFGEARTRSTAGLPAAAEEEESRKGALLPAELMEAIARATGARVLASERPILPGGSSSSLAFEQAYLVAVMSKLACLGLTNGTVKTYWVDGLPVAHVSLPHDCRATVIAARPDPEVPGDGLSVGVVMRRPRNGPEGVRTHGWEVQVSLTLVVPVRSRDGSLSPVASACSLEITTPFTGE